MLEEGGYGAAIVGSDGRIGIIWAARKSRFFSFARNERAISSIERTDCSINLYQQARSTEMCKFRSLGRRGAAKLAMVLHLACLGHNPSPNPEP